MSTVAEHYQQLLAEHYIWMFGIPFEEKVAEQKALLGRILNSSLGPARNLALDLGCGPGFQTLALAQLGYTPVIAIDTSRELLRELEARVDSCAIETRLADLMSLASLPLPAPPVVIVCMGDTITHLASTAAVQAFISAVFAKLAPGGTFVLTYRDLTGELVGVERFLPVRSDENKILTCFLEYQSDRTVMVHDLLYQRESSGWRLHKSSYPKCRLAQAWVTHSLRAAGFEIEREEPAGRLILVVARKPACG